MGPRGPMASRGVVGPCFGFPSQRDPGSEAVCCDWVRPYLVESTTSRPICEVKQLQA